MARFTVPVNDLGVRLTTRLEAKARDGLGRLFTNIVMRTPVHTGKTRANWNTSEGSPNYTVANVTDVNHALNQIAKIKEMPIGAKIFLANGMPNIRLLEYGGYPNPPKHPTGRTVDGFSSQAPAGMVRISVAEFKRNAL